MSDGSDDGASQQGQEQRNAPRGFPLIRLLVVVAILGTGLGIYVEHGKMLKAQDDKKACDSEVATLRQRQVTTEESIVAKNAALAAKDAYISGCKSALTDAPNRVAARMREREACLQSHEDARAKFTGLAGMARQYPLLDVEAPKGFSDTLTFELGGWCLVDMGTWTLHEETCTLVEQGGRTDSVDMEVSPDIALIVALAVDHLGNIAQEPPVNPEVSDGTYLARLQADPEAGQIALLDGSFLHDLLGNTDDPESLGCWYIATHLFRLAAPLAADEETVNTLADWVLTLVRDHKLFSSRVGSFPKRYLADLWDASWADFRTIDKWMKEDKGLYGSEHYYYDSDGSGKEGPCLEVEGEERCAHELTDKREGWFYRRWKAAGGGERGDRLINTYRRHMIAMAGALAMPTFVQKWQGQLDAGEGPAWPKPKE